VLPVPALRLGALIALVALGFAAVVGLVAVVDTDSPAAGAGLGLGVAVLVFLTGATLACALACLARGRLVYVALGSVAVAGLAVDLAVLAIWREIDSEAYGKVTVIAMSWTLLALVVLSLTLAVGDPGESSRYVYLAAVVVAAAAGLILTWLVSTAGTDEIGAEAFGAPVGVLGDDGLLRALGAALVLLSTLWFAALATSRLERAAR
jgi:hypothetical protein